MSVCDTITATAHIRKPALPVLLIAILLAKLRLKRLEVWLWSRYITIE